MFRKILVANRGEIAVRIIRTCRRLGVGTVAVYSEADVKSAHARLADEAVAIGPPPVRESYLNVDAIVDAVRRTGAEAVHPGYGLLSENADFARAVLGAGASFVGPPVEALEAFGDKIRAREVARSVGVEPPPGTEGPLDPEAEERLRAEAHRIGYPIVVKTAGGGGGIGMQIVHDPDKLAKAAQSCSSRGKAAFGDPRVYLEHYLTKPRHIEVQIFRDTHDHGVALGERECSVQRRHQKIIEEAPSPARFFLGEAGEARRRRLFEDALRIVEKVGYVGAGTVEFVAGEDGEPYFLEVNARLQVEHPVTEMVTDLDLVELQLRVAAGEPLPSAALGAKPAGHAIEVRLYAEDPAKKFAPQPGTIERLRWPETSDDLRIDAGVEAGTEVTPFYDPMLAKVVARAGTRQAAIARLDAALAATELVLVGPKGPKATNLEFARRVLASEEFVSGDYDTLLAERLAKGDG